MRKKIIINRDRFPDIGYQSAPLRWILALQTLTPSQKLQLLNYFSHSEVWKLSIRGISKSFGRGKSTEAVRRDNQVLTKLGYLFETEDSYCINLERIKKDYNKSMGKDGIISTTGPEDTTGAD